MINKLSEINLNLLNVLDVMLTERNTTTAGKKLHITQPSISYSLKQLREIFDDELLVKNNFRSKMSMTPLAKSLVKPAREAVQKLESIFKIKEFDPKTSRRVIKIATSDYGLSCILPELIKRVNEEAPLVSFRISDVIYSKTREQLEDEDIDIAIGAFNLEKEKSSLTYEYLLTDNIVCWADKNHPAFQSEALAFDDYMEYPHLIIRHPKSGSESTVEDSAFKEIIDSGSITNISTHNSSESFSLLPGTDYICLAAQRMNIHAKYYDLTYKIPPFKVSKLTLSLCRHIDKDNDQAVLWIISQIKNIVKKKNQVNALHTK